MRCIFSSCLYRLNEHPAHIFVFVFICQEQAEIATGLGNLLKSTRGLIAAEAKGQQSTIASAANVVPGQLLGSLVQHLQNKVSQQHEVLERVIFCRKRLAPLEQERVQLEMIGMKDELKLNQGTTQKLNHMLDEALKASDEITEVAKAAKKTRDMHAAAADGSLVTNLDMLVANVQLKHTQISLADASSTAGAPSVASTAGAPPVSQPVHAVSKTTSKMGQSAVNDATKGKNIKVRVNKHP